MNPLWIVGAGGHAKVVIDAARASGQWEIVGLLDDDPRAASARVLGVEVLGPADRATVDRLGATNLVLAVGSNRARLDLDARLKGCAPWATVVHPRAYLACDVTLGEGTVVSAGAIIQPSARVGRHVIVNTGASVDHDCSVGDFVHIAPGSRLAGGVEVADLALLGLGSCVLPGRRIGRGAILGAGGVVVADVPDSSVAVGIPARTRSPR